MARNVNCECYSGFTCGYCCRNAKPYHFTPSTAQEAIARQTDVTSSDYGYLQHGRGTAGPFRTERVRVKNEYADRWLAFFEGKWRRVHVQVNRLHIVFRGERIAIQIEGV